MNNEQLVSLIRAGENVSENMAQLYSQVKGFINSVAWHYRNYAELEDLEQEGFLALYDAVAGYNPAAGYQFLTYAGWWIRQRIVRYIQSNRTVRIPEDILAGIQKMQKLEREYFAEYGKKPRENEIAFCLGITIPKVRHLQKALRMEQIRSLDGYVDDEENTILSDLVPGVEDVESTVLDATELQQLQSILWPMVDALQGEQSAVIRARYQQLLTAAQAGKLIGISETQVRNLERNGLKELYRKRYKLRPFLPEVLGSLAYHGGAEEFNRTWTSSTERVAMRL